MSGDRGQAVLLASGVAWYPFDPRPEDVRAEDFRALANICRWGGHVRVWMSVAEHCVRVADVVRSWNLSALSEYTRHGLKDPSEAHRLVELEAVVHDLHEVVPPGDVPGPMLYGEDPWARETREMERRAAFAFRDALGVPRLLSPSVHLADLQLLATESRDLMPEVPLDHFAGLPMPLAERIEPWPAEVAWARWKERYTVLGGRWP